MYKRITIIGLGTLGGFLAKSISNIEEVKLLTLIDYDYVEKRNLRNQIYSEKDVGFFKVNCLYRILKLKRSNLKLRRIIGKYEEEITKIPKSDLVIDCRDFTYDRRDRIHVRTYLTSRYLIVDCQRNVKYEKHHEGKYLTELTKHDLEYASWAFCDLIIKGVLKKLIYDQIIYNIPLDHNIENAYNTIDKTNKFDLVIDSQINDKKLKNLHDVGLSLDTIKKRETIICIGDQRDPLIQKRYPENHFNNLDELVSSMLSLISTANQVVVYQHYIICKKIVDNKCYVQLLPETGAA